MLFVHFDCAGTSQEVKALTAMAILAQEIAFRDAGMAFALSSDHTAMGKVLVLIASIHKFYPSTKVLLYDRLEEKEVSQTGPK
ncbi:unnamed protein product [Cylicostephanus goldi]|uniref:Uncharacterized protein n=1 Tax=Cylicostephanus goldi TaxID=71465 RepID=A0A3P6SUE9_CYLGO|nr:unnamed protein product [Cylicostephanus goldi]